MNRKLILIVMAAVLTMALAGCSGNLFSGTEDKNTVEAKSFDVSQKLDKGDYDSILAMPADSVNPLDYAAAAMGSAGLSPTTLIDALNNISNSSASGGVSNSSDMSSMTGLPINTGAMQYLDTALTSLDSAILSNPTDPDLNFQLSLTSLVGTITSLGSVGQTYASLGYAPKVAVAPSLTGFDPSNGIDNNEATQLGNFISAVYNGSWQGAFVDVNNDGIDDTVQVLLDVRGTSTYGNDDIDFIKFISKMVRNVRHSLKYANLGNGSELHKALSDMTSKPGGLNYTCWVCDETHTGINAFDNTSSAWAGNDSSCILTNDVNDPMFTDAGHAAFIYGEKLCVNGDMATADPVTDQDVIDYLTNVLAQ